MNKTLDGKRMIDKVIAMPKFIPSLPQELLDMKHFRMLESEVRLMLPKAQIFEISNIAEYYWNGTDQEYWIYSKTFRV